jgi:hypothetical protein
MTLTGFLSRNAQFSAVQGNQGMARRQTVLYAAQAIPQTCHVFSVIDAEIAEKGHL